MNPPALSPTGRCSAQVMWLAVAWLGLTVPGIAASADEAPARVDVFTSGTDGYNTFRIPSLLVTPRGGLLAFSEGRKTGAGDAGDIDLVVRRSDDNGQTWGPLALVYEEGGGRPVTIGNPCPVVDASTGTIWLTFTRNNREVFMMSSGDDGRTWSKPRDITATVKKAGWSWYATGPGVGIQLRSGPHAGRLVIPCDHREPIDGQTAMVSHVFLSDDHGQTWTVGGSAEKHTDECQVVELTDGTLLLNMRNYWGTTGGRPERGGRRALARSRDGGATWGPLEFDAALIEPICQASMIRVDDPGRRGSSVLLFSNPASTRRRQNMTVRASRDDGKTWDRSLVIDPGPSAYSCLAALPNGRIGLIYERGGSKFLTFTTVSHGDLRPAP